MIVLARSVDADARAVRKAYEDGVEAPIRSATERIAKARFATLGTSVYPDATFTLRLNYGTVQGWNENGNPVEPFTRLSRAFERATGSEPFLIPESWQRVKDKLDMNTPFNLSTNNDIVGGNSGSALINAKAEIVGLIFDGNIHSVSGAYWFDTAKNRAVAVHPAIMREAMSKVYGADALMAELIKVMGGPPSFPSGGDGHNGGAPVRGGQASGAKWRAASRGAGQLPGGLQRRFVPSRRRKTALTRRRRGTPKTGPHVNAHERYSATR